MKYYSLKNKSIKSSFKQAVLAGIAEDKGLYFPNKIEKLNEKFYNDLINLSELEISFEVMKQFVGNEINSNKLIEILEDTISFDFPLIKLSKNIYTLELFHGPTMAFKDVGARFMSRCINYFINNTNKKVSVLVATSGDTGGAVASGFNNISGTEVIILYPKGRVSDIQEKQLTTNGKNVRAFEVDGSFDDCQKMVKDAFVDKDLKKTHNLTSANSINVARWLPQSLYYFFTMKKFEELSILNKVVFSVPSGNFGNICAGIVASKLGLNIKHFVASTNSNDTVTRFLRNGKYQPNKTIRTLSNAMDVSDPSNFIRIKKLYENDLKKIKNNFTSYSFNDNETVLALKEIYNDYKYIADPHGAIGFLGLKKYLKTNRNNFGVFFETAHPIKFRKTVESNLDINLKYPLQIKRILNKKKRKESIKSYEELKEAIMF